VDNKRISKKKKDAISLGAREGHDLRAGDGDDDEDDDEESADVVKSSKGTLPFGDHERARLFKCHKPLRASAEARWP